MTPTILLPILSGIRDDNASKYFDDWYYKLLVRTGHVSDGNYESKLKNRVDSDDCFSKRSCWNSRCYCFESNLFCATMRTWQCGKYLAYYQKCEK